MEGGSSGGNQPGGAWRPAAGGFDMSTPSDSSTPPSETTDDGFTDVFSSPEDDDLRALGMPFDDLEGVEMPASWVEELPRSHVLPPRDRDTPTTLLESPASTLAEEAIVPPDSPPGETFAAAFLGELCTSGALITTKVWGLQASPSRKWGLERELPAGWYLLDRTSPGATLPLFDAKTVETCQWKVTGRQISQFDRQMPIQIRYCNPKAGCSATYAPMRAAVYTFCTEAATGEVVESDQRLIHVYVGRASRQKSTRRKAGGASVGAPDYPVGPVKPLFKSGPVGAHRRAFNMQAPQSALQTHSNNLNAILKEVMDQLRAQNMDEAAAVVQAVVQNRFSTYRAADAFAGSVLRRSTTKLIERTDVSMARVLMESLKEQERESIPPSLRRKLQALCSRAETDLDILDKTVHVLFMSRDATEDLHINRELQAIYARVASTNGHPASIPVVFTVVPNASAYTLWTTLTRARENFSHIHFSGHGSDASGSTLLLAASPDHFDPHSPGGGEYQTDAPVNDRAFANAIAQYHNRLPVSDAVKSVVLNACSTTDQGIALINHGIPHVCVNDGQISDHVAVAFSSAFYEQIALGNGVPVAHERAVNWVMLNVNERAYKLGGINGLRLMSASTTIVDNVGATHDQDIASAAPAAVVRTTKQVADLIRADLGLADSQCETVKQLADAAIAELGIRATGSLRDRLQAAADELHISTGWNRATGACTEPHAGETCPNLGGQGAVWLKPWAHYALDCPKAREMVCKMVTEHGADRVRHALDKTWLHMQQRRLQMSECDKQKCTRSDCYLKFMETLKASVSSSLQPCGQASSLCDCTSSLKRIWGCRQPSDEERAIVQRLVSQMDFDPVAAAIAVRETGGSGLQPAVEWLLQNLDSLTSLSAALLESTTSDGSMPATSPATTPEPAPEPAISAQDARQERHERLGQTAAPVQLDVFKQDLTQLLQTLGFDDDIFQTTLAMLEDGGLLASLQRPGLDAQAAIQNVMQSAVRLAFTLKLSDEASNGGGECARHPETAQELLASLTSGSGSTDDESQSLDALSPRSTSD